jgi:hypothetical protein
VEFPTEEAIFGMVLNRLVDPDSKLGTYDWLKEKVFRLSLRVWSYTASTVPWISWRSASRQ